MTNPTTVFPLRQRMIEDMTARGLGQQSQRGHIRAYRRFAAYLKRSPETATAEDVRLFQLHLMESGLTIQNRNRTMTGLRFLLRVTMRRLDLAAELFHMKEPVRVPQILSAEEAKRLLLMADKLQVRMLFSIGYGAGLRVSEVVKLDLRHASSWLSLISPRYKTWRCTTRPPATRLFSTTEKVRCSLPSFRRIFWRRNMAAH
jgi:site-specific recombinase XerD